ncbi:alkane 1-monooxygenase [Lutimaribacter sp. EGI FJ00015]|uniref:Alkane 1-monooxygenase n=1 Tax=Lutimaribacter degradans TaxID=2945989 RepID=A0ACC5ZRL6_9RHOB|nr:alkane 1-monooxygenase [Lutimaribacter sp. EGI FJ00013]MCM2560727.1 alkane 1-monooxygenase [Lutimaribacter sp. EGI FJ00013]MCO0612327.1 alkane 1-monooxygenase [Lutimaribacter sp. EGI FJ00015]MCO0634552.1 alkane 1-monooxygenase [Lutimaribacter sp. EGI FJ00014]
MIFFDIATLLPVVLLFAGAILGGGWVWGAVLWITVLTWALDHLVRRAAVVRGVTSEFPTGTGLAVGLGVLHFPLMAVAVWAVGGASGHDLLHRLGLLVAFGLFFGQVGHPNAHELIHKSTRWQQWLGRAIYVVLLMGHHASSHLRVHHIHVGTARDPASAPAGLGFWRYAMRAWPGSFLAGLHAENALRARAATPPPAWSNPYAGYLGGAALCLGAAVWIGGLTGMLAYLGIAAYAQLQILLSDYLQHYGLRRRVDANGRPEPVGPRHSWNGPQFWSSAMMLNAPRHSHHHTHPGVAFPALDLTDQMPTLPRAVPVMAVVALVPPLWKRMMARHVARWANDK